MKTTIHHIIRNGPKLSVSLIVYQSTGAELHIGLDQTLYSRVVTLEDAVHAHTKEYLHTYTL